MLQKMYSNSTASNWAEISHEFSSCHKNPSNIFMHLVTTPLGLIGIFSLLKRAFKTSLPSAVLTYFYFLSLLGDGMPSGVVVGTIFILTSIVAVASRLNLDIKVSVAFIILGYILQDMSHYASGEDTLQSKYSGENGHVDLGNIYGWFTKLNEQNYYLLPLLVHVSEPQMQLSGAHLAWFSTAIPDVAVRISAFKWLVTAFSVFVFGQYAIDTNNFFCFWPGVPFFNRVVKINIVNDENGKPRSKEESCKADLKCVRDFAMSTNPPETCSTHFWYETMPEKPKEAFSRCAKSSVIINAFREIFSESFYKLDNIEGMDEVYITGPARLEEEANSDQVFYTRHVDGPWAFVPFVSVYRCIIGMDVNKVITTHFPLANVANNACEGDVLGFDFNREVHYITRDDSQAKVSDKFRVVLKTHYVMYPRILAPIGWLMSKTNENYNRTFRILFLKTIKPTNAYERFLAWNVNFQTWVFDRIETLLGMRNIFYIVFVSLLAYLADNYNIFLVSTSFVHYFRYITTYYFRGNVDFGSFKRDVLLFKSLALAQLFYFYAVKPLYLGTFQVDVLSLSMILIGYSISIMATQALGIDRTYFGSELGLMPPKWVNQFPYGYIPHPMIVSQIFALAGIHVCDHFNKQYPQLVLVHILLYVVHMIQEHLDLHQNKVLFRENSSGKVSAKVKNA